MKRVINAIVISASMALLGSILVTAAHPDTKDYLSNPWILSIVIITSVGLWLKAARDNQGNLKSFLTIIAFGILSPLAGALIAGLATGFIGGVFIATMIVVHAWYITFPIGLITGFMIFLFTGPKA